MDRAYITNEEHLEIDRRIMKGFLDMEIDSRKVVLQIKDVIILAKKIGFAISPSQATEALFFAKGDVDKLKNPFDDDDLRRFVKWFYDNRQILRLNTKNYLKYSRKHNNNSMNVRPNIKMIPSPEYDDKHMTSRFPTGLDILSPKSRIIST
jgi:hypothetical protein